MKSLFICSVFFIAVGSVFATTTYYPGNSDGPSAVDIETKPPVYYPPQKPNPMINPGPSHSQTNPQLPQEKLPPSSADHNDNQ